jgi:hypothetical protein
VSNILETVPASGRDGLNKRTLTTVKSALADDNFPHDNRVTGWKIDADLCSCVAPVPAGAQQNAMFTPAAFHLRDLFWTERETMIGKVVDMEYLAGATKGRMGRIFRLREDIVSGTSLGL